ncbi:hypothetical protein HOLleu_09551 [Holothuria leucospilota]|uniref:Uncharacterized protein n=1 Tax=Holothuria leucospilota TaxID=206669 RepID=A0A9Q1CD22_HOLLE|nr:hypothetical protein HOLleu_09551 [Holothuria leucospilota]
MELAHSYGVRDTNLSDFSKRSHPFPSTEESMSSLDVLPSPPDEWPGRYQTLKNRRVFDCWEEEVSLRPSLNQLRLSFTKIADSLEPCYDRPTVTPYLENVEESSEANTDQNTYQ